MKKKVKILLGVVLLCVCAVGGLLVWLRPKPVQVAVLAPGPMVQQVTEQGEVAPAQSGTVLATTSGIVREIALEVGRPVREGEPLFTIDASALEDELESQIESLKLQQSAVYSGNSAGKAELNLRRTQLEQQLTTAHQEYDRLFGEDGSAEALLSIAQTSYGQARRAYREAKEEYEDLEDSEEDSSYIRSQLSSLRSQMYIAEENLVIAENNGSDSTRAYYEELIASCEAQLAALGNNDAYANNSAYASAQQLQLTIDRLSGQIGRGSVPAPYDGTGWALLVEVGDYVAENQPLATLYRSGAMQVEVLLLAEDALLLRPGDAAQCRFADGSTAEAVVRFVSPVAETIVSTIGLSEKRCKVELDVPRLPENVGAGHQAQLTFSFTAAEHVLSVPAGSIVPYEAGYGVYVARDSRAALIPVETGLRQSGLVEIRSGLAVGDRVILAPFDSGIADGDAVRLPDSGLSSAGYAAGG